MKRRGTLLLETRKMLQQLGLRARKGLGQHFLVDDRVLGKIISAAELSSKDLVVEVGPGLGILTQELARCAGKVLAVEIDSEYASALEKNLADFPNVSLICADILELDPLELLKDEVEYKVVANLPYYVASSILRRFLEASLKPKLLVIMMQKEVARSIIASPGSLGLLSVAVQLYARPRLVDYVPAKSFYPPPKVDSAILRLEVFEKPAVAVDKGSFFRVVRAGFSAPRKQLRNSLARGLSLPPSTTANLLQRAEINPQRRAQTLSLEEWAELSTRFQKIL